MKSSAGLFGHLQGFRRDRRGNFAVASAILISGIMMGAGFALNIAQLTLTRSNLLQALDSAVTSTARDLTTRTIEPDQAREMILAFLQGNGGAGFALADDVKLENVVIDRTARTVAATASVGIDLAFPVFSTGARKTVTVASKALYSDKRIEIAMMLDITGSMSGQKIEDLKTAAKSAVGTFLTNQSKDDPRVRVAIVPYADSVNSGMLAHTVQVEKEYSTDEPAPLTDVLLASIGTGAGSLLPDGTRRPDACATERRGLYQFSDASPARAMVVRDFRLQFCPSSPLSPLTSDLSKLESLIDGFRADGSTAGHIGVQWTWYMLSSKWKAVLPAASAPARSTDGKTAKFAVLMTDGEFNTAFAGVGRREQTRTRQQARSRNNAERLCAEMKKDGIEIFTVGFMLSESEARQVMSRCASPDSGSTRHYFEAANGEELDAAFKEVAKNIERLAIIE